MTVDVLTLVMTFIYTIGHWIAEKVVWIIVAITGVDIPPTIVDTIGLLIVLTIFLSLADIAKKIVWSNKLLTSISKYIHLTLSFVTTLTTLTI